MGCIASTPEPQQQYSAAAVGGNGVVVQPPGKAPLADVIFFPEANGKMPCHNANKPGGCHRQNCNFEHGPTNIGKFLSYLTRATRSLDICVFTITCDEISNAVMDMHKRGVRVRVITDDDQSETQGSDIQSFRQCGIPVKVDHMKTHMHHKFAILDGVVLMTGSFNWTRQAVLGNQENVVILDNPFLVQQFQGQFEKLWAMFRA